MRVKKTLFATDESGVEVLIGIRDEVSEITDAGPVEIGGNYCQYWSVSFRVTPSHKQWSEIVTCDSISLLKALEG